MHSEPPISWPIRNKFMEHVPGLGVVAILTAAAFALHGFIGFSPMIIAIIAGVGLNSMIGAQPALAAGISLAGKSLLRVAVALLGLQLTLRDISDIGLSGLLVAALAVVLTYLFTLFVGRTLKVDTRLTHLIAAGTSICGASAVAATNTVVKARDEDVSYAVGCVTLFGTIAMVCFPIVNEWLLLGPRLYGIWTGASVHEVAQVVGAAFQGGAEAGHFGVVTKLTRVLMLAPVIVVLGNLMTSAAPGRTRAQANVPAFVIAFIVLAVANSIDLIPGPVSQPLVAITPVLLTAALGALGLGTSFRALRAEGTRPLLLALAAALFISATTFLLVRLIM